MTDNKDKTTSSSIGKALKPALAVTFASFTFCGGFLYLTSPTRMLDQALSCDYEWLETRLTQTGQTAEHFTDLSERSRALSNALQTLAKQTTPDVVASRNAGTIPVDLAKDFRTAWKAFSENSDLIASRNLKTLTLQPVDSNAQLQTAAKAFQQVEDDATRQAQQLLKQSMEQSAKAQEMLKRQTRLMAQEMKNPVGFATLDDIQQKHEMKVWKYLAASPSQAACQPSPIPASIAKWRST